MGRAGGKTLTSPHACRRHILGIRCAAWEDGKCTPGSTAASLDGMHTCNGTDASSCEAHWPSYDFTQDQSWCCDSWCYVDNTTCTPELQAKYGISLADSWTGAALKYSYEACADPWSAPQAQEVVDYSPQTFSQVILHAYLAWHASMVRPGGADRWRADT